MAIYSFTVSNVSRAGGASAVSTLAYITGKKYRDKRTGTTYSYGHRDRVCRTGTIVPDYTLPELSDTGNLINEIEQKETSGNARTAVKIIAALPREFDVGTQKMAVEKFIQDSITVHGYGAVYAIHMDEEGSNPHVHILIPNRPIDRMTGAYCSVKRKMAYALDDSGNRIPIIDQKTGRQKVDKRNRKQWKRVCVERNLLDTKDFLCTMRTGWADACNTYLDANIRISEKSYADRGIQLVPTVHVGAAQSAMHRKGVILDHDKVVLNQSIQHYNRAIQVYATIIPTLMKKRVSLLFRIPFVRHIKERLLGRGERNGGADIASGGQGEPACGDTNVERIMQGIGRRKREAEQREREIIKADADAKRAGRRRDPETYARARICECAAVRRVAEDEIHRGELNKGAAEIELLSVPRYGGAARKKPKPMVNTPLASETYNHQAKKTGGMEILEADLSRFTNQMQESMQNTKNTQESPKIALKMDSERRGAGGTDKNLYYPETKSQLTELDAPDAPDEENEEEDYYIPRRNGPRL